jgi:hypothetical protein
MAASSTVCPSDIDDDAMGPSGNDGDGGTRGDRIAAEATLIMDRGDIVYPTGTGSGVRPAHNQWYLTDDDAKKHCWTLTNNARTASLTDVTNATRERTSSYSYDRDDNENDDIQWQQLRTLIGYRRGHHVIDFTVASQDTFMKVRLGLTAVPSTSKDRHSRYDSDSDDNDRYGRSKKKKSKKKKKKKTILKYNVMMVKFLIKKATGKTSTVHKVNTDRRRRRKRSNLMLSTVFDSCLILWHHCQRWRYGICITITNLSINGPCEVYGH